MNVSATRFVTALAAAIIATSGANAAVIVASNVADYNIRGTTTDTDAVTNDGKFQLGRGTVDSMSGTGNVDAVYVFELPVLGNAILSANLKFSVVGENQNTFGSFANLSVDLKGEGFQNNSTPITSFSGSTLIQNDILDGDNFKSSVSPTFPTLVETDTSGDAALANYLQTFYGANPGYAGGSFVFFRLDENGSNVFDSVRLLVDSSEYAASTPVLEITTIPEPASLALLGLGGFLIISRSRRA